MLLLLLEHRILCLVKLTDKMVPVKRKFIRILSDGSLNVCYKYYASFKQVEVCEKDNKNFHFNKKEVNSITQLESSSSYKKKYLV